jgi:NAD(P)-dependent dehydrogenase (short-subunit alcohol dehydrogenase family)
MSNSNYNWNIALVTGGAGGIGRALTEHFLSLGKVDIHHQSEAFTDL